MEPAQTGPSHRAPRQPFRLPRRALIAGAAAVVAVAGIVTGLELSGPSYPHAWCGPVLNELHTKGGSEAAFENALTQIQQNDGAPLAALLSDLASYDAANADVQTSNNFQVLGALGSAEGALNAVKLDLEQINRECGQPASAASKDSI
jgi:hypothetical protein